MKKHKTGPKTPEGREKSSNNALKHGLTSSKMFVLSNETPEKWHRLLDVWTARLQPRDEAEMQIVTEAAFARWRLQRVWTIETSRLDLEMDTQAPGLAGKFEIVDEGIRQAAAFKGLSDDSLSLEQIHRYETRYRRSFERALATLQTLREMEPPDDSGTSEEVAPPSPQLVRKKQPHLAARPQNKFLPNEFHHPSQRAENVSPVTDIESSICSAGSAFSS
jgi:hypothetical protein